MTIMYNFGDDYHDECFEYELDDLGDFIDSLSTDELIDFAMNHLNKDDELRDELLSNDFLLKEVINDFEDDFIEEYRDSIEDFYRDDAFEQYEDCKEYSRDPYSYYGVSRKDFF